MEQKMENINQINQQTIQITSEKIDKKDQNQQKVIVQTFKYYRAKKNKQRFIRIKKIQEMKSYQSKLIAIIKKKSEQTINSLVQFTNQIIKVQQMQNEHQQTQQEQKLIKLKQKITELNKFSKQNEQNEQKDNLMRVKLRRVRLECQQQLQKLQSTNQFIKSDEEMEKIINRIEKPFKKMLNYFSILRREINSVQNHFQDELKRKDTQLTAIGQNQ